MPADGTQDVADAAQASSAHLLSPAPSGRAKCRACKQLIEKGALRLEEKVPNAFGEGDASHYYHVACGAWRRPEAFLVAAGSFASELADRDALVRDAEFGARYHRLRRFVRAELASTGRARCQGCREVIDKGAIRLVLERIDDGMVHGSGFVHVGCAHRYASAVTGVLAHLDLSVLGPDEAASARASLAEQAELPLGPETAPGLGGEGGGNDAGASVTSAEGDA